MSPFTKTDHKRHDHHFYDSTLFQVGRSKNLKTEQSVEDDDNIELDSLLQKQSEEILHIEE
jgi:hypothetical protein